jgi:hypothetical protein
MSGRSSLFLHFLSFLEVHFLYVELAPLISSEWKKRPVKNWEMGDQGTQYSMDSEKIVQVKGEGTWQFF